MTETLSTGVRRLPSAQDIATVIAKDSGGVKALPGAVLVDAVLGTAYEERLLAHSCWTLVNRVRAETRKQSTSTQLKPDGQQGTGRTRRSGLSSH